MLEGARHEWHCFRDDAPGKRFTNHHRRAHRSHSKAKIALRIGLGALLVAAGVVMLFVPGPGLLAILFGVALVGGESKTISGWLDRGEVGARTWWRHRSRAAKVAVIAAAVLVAGAVTLATAWRFLEPYVAPYLG